MPNGQQMINDFELEDQIKSFSDPEKFLARQIYDIKKRCAECIPVSGSKKQTAFNAAGVTALVVAVAEGIRSVFMKG